MATYHRPNLSAENRDTILSALKVALDGLDVDSPGFDAIYQAFIKVRDAKPFTT